MNPKKWATLAISAFLVAVVWGSVRSHLDYGSLRAVCDSAVGYYGCMDDAKEHAVLFGFATYGTVLTVSLAIGAAIIGFTNLFSTDPRSSKEQ
jgi:hypothetical protein